MGCIIDDDVLVFNIIFFVSNVAALMSEIIKFLNCTPLTGMGGKQSTLLSSVVSTKARTAEQTEGKEVHF